jgi:hypothetical protein
MPPLRLIATFVLLGSFAVSPPAVAAPEAPSIQIGNFFPASPDGVAFIANDSTAFLVELGLRKEFHPETAAPDGAYHEEEFQDGSLTMAWGRVNDGIVAKLSSTRSRDVVLVLSSATWPGFSANYVMTADGATGSAGKAGQSPPWKLQVSLKPERIEDKRITVKVSPGAPTYFVAGFGSLPRFDQIDGLLSQGARRYDARRPLAQGAWGDFLGAIADNLNNTRLYSSDLKMVAHTVTRGWVPATEPNASPLFCWDSFFNGLLACLDDPATARNTVRAVLAGAQPDGFVPNFSHWNVGRGYVSKNRSQPPVGAMCVWKMQQFQPDPAFLKEVYPKLAKWHRWWLKARDGNHDGLLEWGGDVPLYECGWDDTPQFDGTKKQGVTLNANAIDLNSLYVADAQYLAKIADALGLHSEAAAYRAESAQMTKKINATLWNKDAGVYCSRLWDGTFLTRITPMNFYPLIAGIPDQAQARSMLVILTDPKKFWGTWLLPTVPYDDPLYPDQAYWRGKVWAPVNYLVFQGLKQYGTPAQIREFAGRSVDLFMRNWNRDRVCGENYLSTTGEQNGRRSEPHYTWGALLCMVGLESLVDIGDNGKAQFARDVRESLQLRHIPVGGQPLDVTFDQGRVTAQPSLKK